MTHQLTNDRIKRLEAAVAQLAPADAAWASVTVCPDGLGVRITSADPHTVGARTLHLLPRTVDYGSTYEDVAPMIGGTIAAMRANANESGVGR